MGVESIFTVNLIADREGQSLLEFLLTLPVLVALAMIMVKVNTAIQISIVNQQYARAQTLFIAFNSAEFPSLQLRSSSFWPQGYNNMTVGVSENAAPAPDSGDEYVPLAQEAIVTRTKSRAGAKGEAGQEADARKGTGIVRVRNTVTMCTQINAVQGDSGFTGLHETTLPFEPKNPQIWSENIRFEFCRSPLDE